MKCDAFLERLDALLDDELESGEARALQRHAADCASCGKQLATARHLQELAFALPSEREPERDLWPGIEERISRRRQHAGIPWLRAVAAGLVVAAVFFSGVLVDRAMRDDAQSQAPQLVERETRPAEHRLPSVDDARRLLPASYVQLVEGSGNGVPTGAEQELLQNLLLVNLAIREVQDAAVEDPSNADLRQLLAGLYAQENRILSQAERLQVSGQATLRTGI